MPVEIEYNVDNVLTAVIALIFTKKSLSVYIYI